MKLLFSALFVVVVAAIFAGAVTYLVQILTEMDVANLNFVPPLYFPR